MAVQPWQIERKPKRETWAYWFLGPATLMIVLVFIYPLVVAFWTSLHYDVMVRPTLRHFVGLDNYGAILGEARFWDSLYATAFFFVCTVTLTMVLGLIIALRLDRDMGRWGWLKPLFLVPMVVTPIVVGIQWKFMLNSQIGVITYFARLLGIPVGAWLTEPAGAMFWIVVVDVWQYTPYVILLFSAGLAALPVEVKEAARVDGAGELQVLRFVTLPMLKQVAVTALMIRTIGGLRTFDTILVLTNGGPGRVTEVMNLFAYRMGFTAFDLGKASAIGWLMLIVAFFLVIIYIKILQATAGGETYT